MPHTCNYFCADPIHAVNLLVKLRTPYECLAPEHQASLRATLVSDIRCLSKDDAPLLSIEQLIPVRDCSTVDFYQRHDGWSTPGLQDREVSQFLPYVALVRYQLPEVPDAVS